MTSWTRLAVLLLGVVTSACGVGALPSRGRNSVELTVFAASSLTAAFEEVGTAFMTDHAKVEVKFNFLSSSDLAAQIEQGSPAHVFASADEANMQRIVEAGLAATTPSVFAHNKLEIIVPRGNPGGVKELEDLSKDELVVSLCSDECPAGRYALQVFEKANISVAPDSLEPEVKSVVTRVALGEADAGLAYVTDTQAAGGDVEGVPIPDDANVLATYPIVALRNAPPAAKEFVEFVLSRAGQEILAEYGFLTI
jgi:molybdate transport system substrate-binding protein